MGLDPKTDLNIRSLATNIGDEQTLEDTFGVPCYSTYGFHEVQYVSVECPVMYVRFRGIYLVRGNADDRLSVGNTIIAQQSWIMIESEARAARTFS